MKNYLKNLRKLAGEFSPFSLAFILFCVIIPSNPDLIRNQALFTLSLFTLVYSAKVGMRVGSVTVFIALGYFLLRAVQIFAARYNVPAILSSDAAQSFAWLLLFVSVIAGLSRNARYGFTNALALLCFLSACVMLYRRVIGEPGNFLLNNASADACLVAVLLPVLVMRPWWIFKRSLALSSLAYGIPVIAVAASGSSSAVGIMILGILSYTVQLKKHFSRVAFRNMVLGATFAVSILAAGLYAFSPDEPWKDSGRMQVWKAHIDFTNRTMSPEALKFFQTRATVFTMLHLDRHASPLMGVGSGSWFTFAESVQKAAGQPDSSIFPYSHNEYVGTFFCQGWLGLACMVLVGLAALYKALDRPWVFTALLNYYAMMFFQYPFSYAVSAVVGLFLLAEAFKHHADGTVLNSGVHGPMIHKPVMAIRWYLV